MKLPAAWPWIPLTAIVLVAFAANSLFGRWALESGSIGPAAYTFLRLSAGALVLAGWVGPRRARERGSWTSAGFLVLYAVCFSWAYLSLSTGVGALIIFAAVQFTMIGVGIWGGERLRGGQLTGLTVAIGSFVALFLPGSIAPDPLGGLAMIGSGIGWGLYSLAGRASSDPLGDTAGNFWRAAILMAGFAIPLSWAGQETDLQWGGVMLAIVSGGITSALAYALWYRVVRALGAIRAGVVQLLVPPLATVAGTWMLGESLSVTFALLSLSLLLGVLGVILGKRPASPPVPREPEAGVE